MKLKKFPKNASEEAKSRPPASLAAIIRVSVHTNEHSLADKTDKKATRTNNSLFLQLSAPNHKQAQTSVVQNVSGPMAAAVNVLIINEERMITVNHFYDFQAIIMYNCKLFSLKYHEYTERYYDQTSIE